MCSKITHPIYATENNNIVLGLIDHPPASPTENRELPAAAGAYGPPPRGFLPPLLAPAF